MIKESCLFSLIIPVYNCENYLDDCLKSLTKQNFNADFHEIIIVDDGSTDLTPKIILNYSNEYKFIKYFKKENGGVSSARNFGLKKASGKYIAFIDSDDYIAPNTYLPIIDILEKNDFSGFYFGFTSDEQKIEAFDGNYYLVKKENSAKAAVWRMVYIKKIIDNNRISFDEEIYFGEDQLFNYLYAQSCKSRIAATAQCLYFYRLNESQSTSNIKKRNGVFANKYIDSYLESCVRIKTSQIKNDYFFKELYSKALSSALTTLLWGGLIFKKMPSETMKLLREKRIFLSDINKKNFEGHQLKFKVKSLVGYLFRFPLFYRLCCFAYRITH